MMSKLFTLALCAFLLSACVSGKPKTETFTDSNGKTTVIQNDRDICTQSCNDDYSRCMDAGSAQDNSGINGPRGMFGANGECRKTLKDCLPGCKSR